MSDSMLLLVDDNERSLKLLSNILENEGYRTLLAHSGRQALTLLEQRKIHLVISDIAMPNGDGYDLCYKIRQNAQIANTPVIIYSDTFTSEREDKVAAKLGADLFIRKPALRDTLLTAVQQLLASPSVRELQNTDSHPDHDSQQDDAKLIDKLQERNVALEQSNSILESIVFERTRELDKKNEALTAANEELQVGNEELTALNEELTALNDQLVLANEKIRQQSDIIIQQQQEALIQSRRNMEIIFSNTQEEILVIDAEGKIVFFNSAFEKFSSSTTGKTPETGMFLWDVTMPESKKTSKELFRKALQGDRSELETTFDTVDGPKTHLLHYSPVFIDDTARYVTVIATDITDKKVKELQLRRSEINLKAIFDNTEDHFTLLDEDLNIVAFNDNNARYVHKVTGKTMVLGSNLLDYISAERRDSFRDLILRANVDKQVKSVAPYEVNGEENWFDVSIMPVINHTGKITGYCITSHDITAVRIAQIEVARLNKSLIDFQNAVHRSSIVSITDRQGIITFVNENFIAISGYSPDELVGKSHRIISSEYHPSSFWKEMWSTISSGNVWHNRIKNRAKKGSHYWVDTFIMPFLDPQGNIESYLSITYDITERTQAEEDLVQKSLLLQEATRMAKIGYWLHDRRKGSSVVSPEMLTLLGVSTSEYNRNAAVLFSRVHPEDAGTLPSIPQLSQMNSEKVEIEYRVKTSDGSIRWIHQRSEANPIDANQDVIIGTVQDITERKIIEQILRDYNERFEILSKATNDAIWDLDIRLEVVVWNYALTELFGYVEGQIEYNFRWWQQRIHPDDRANVLQDLEHVMMNKKNTWRITYRFRCADNSYKHVYNRAYILYEKNVPIRIIGSIQDISERVRSSREIEKLSLVASATNNGVMITDKNGHIEWINKSIEKLTGYTLNEVIGKKPSFLQGKESDKGTIERISKNLKEQQFVSEEIINYTKTGNKFWLKLDIAPVFNSQGLLTNFIAIQTDITEIKEFQRSITNIARELASLIENANVPIFGIDITGYINEWNGIAEKLTGFSKNEVIARQWQEIFRIPSQENNLNKLIKNVLSNTPESNFELPLLTKDGNKLMILISGSPRRNVENEITGALFVGQDITELSDYRSNLEQMVDKRTTELHVSLNKEKELVKLKSQFVSIASHEFRTPLTSIGLAAGFIRKYKSKLSPEGIDEKIINIEKQVNHMTYLLDDILMIGKAEAGKIPVNLAPIKISEFTRNLCFEVARTTGNTHHINLTEELRYLEIVSDEKLLRNVMINLLTNAIKFSPSAEVVEVKIITSGDTLLLTVCDYGIGIPKQEIANLFQPFFRARNAGTIQGTGLGLSIIKKAVDLLQGTIRIDSGQGEGTVITIELPI